MFKREDVIKIVKGLALSQESISTMTGHPDAYERDKELLETLRKHNFKGDIEDAWEMFSEIDSFIDENCKLLKHFEHRVPPDYYSEVALFKCDLPDLKMKFYVVAHDETDSASGFGVTGLSFHKKYRDAYKSFAETKSELRGER